MATKVTLTDATQGARHEPIVVTWEDLNLTGATLTGTKQEVGSPDVTALDGVFAITSAADTGSVFTWTLGAGDVGAAGWFDVQFKATFTDYAMTIGSRWRVHPNQGAAAVAAGVLVGVTAEQAAFLDDVSISSPTDGQVLTWDTGTGTWRNEDAAGGGGGLANIVEDTTPQLGGDLDLNGHVITGLEIGTDVQAHDAGLDDIAALTPTDGNIIVGDGANWTAESGATARASLGLTIGTDVQAQDAELAALAGLASAADRLPYFTGLGTAALAVFTTTGRSLVSGNAANARDVLDLEPGVDVQAYDAQLADIAALAVTDGNIIVGNGTNWVAESGATARTSLGAAAASDLTSHTSDQNNPHGVTAAQANALPENAAILAKSGAYELAAGDEGKIIECNGTFSITCPNGLAAGFQVVLVNVGSGTITVAAATTLQSKAAATQLTAQYASAVVYHRGSNVWLLFGDIA